MKLNKWTLGLAAVGLVSLPAGLQAEEQMSPVQTALGSTIISGYVNTAAQWDFGTGNLNAPGYSFNSGKQDGFAMNAVKLTIEKPLDESTWAAGYKVDLMFGQDANSFGGQSYLGGVIGDGVTDFAVRQAYVAMRAPIGNGLDFKMGIFDTIIGYESHDAGSNPNYTRSYGYSMEPLTHQGLLASYQVNDIIGLSAGVANTVGPTISIHPSMIGGGILGLGGAVNRQAWYSKAESYKSYMGSLSLTAPDSMGFLAGSTLYGGVVNGFNGNPLSTGGTSNGNQTHYYVGSTIATPMEGLRIGVAYDYLDMHAGTNPFSGTEGGMWAWAVAGYITYQATEKLSLHGRGEYFNQSTWNRDGGLPSKIVAGTATVQYDLWKNVISRLEFRWDHSADGSYAYGGSPASPNRPGEPGTRRNHYMVAANVIYQF